MSQSGPELTRRDALGVFGFSVLLHTGLLPRSALSAHVEAATFSQPERSPEILRSPELLSPELRASIYAYAGAQELHKDHALLAQTNNALLTIISYTRHHEGKTADELWKMADDARKIACAPGNVINPSVFKNICHVYGYTPGIERVLPYVDDINMGTGLGAMIFRGSILATNPALVLGGIFLRPVLEGTSIEMLAKDRATITFDEAYDRAAGMHRYALSSYAQLLQAHPELREFASMVDRKLREDSVGLPATAPSWTILPGQTAAEYGESVSSATKLVIERIESAEDDGREAPDPDAPQPDDHQQKEADKTVLDIYKKTWRLLDEKYDLLRTAEEAPVEPVEKTPEEQLKEFNYRHGEIQAAINILNDLASVLPVSPEVRQTVAALGAVHQIMKYSEIALSPALAAAAALGPIGIAAGIIGGITGLFQIFASQHPTPTEQILEAVNSVSKQVEELHLAMNAGFRGMERNFAAVFNQLHEIFVSIKAGQYDIKAKIDQVLKELEEIGTYARQTDVHRLGSSLRSASETLTREITISRASGDTRELSRLLDTMREHARSTATDPAFSYVAGRPIETQLRDFRTAGPGLAAMCAALPQIISGLPSPTEPPRLISKVPNPVLWSVATRGWLAALVAIQGARANEDLLTSPEERAWASELFTLGVSAENAIAAATDLAVVNAAQVELATESRKLWRELEDRLTQATEIPKVKIEESSEFAHTAAEDRFGHQYVSSTPRAVFNDPFAAAIKAGFITLEKGATSYIPYGRSDQAVLNFVQSNQQIINPHSAPEAHWAHVTSTSYKIRVVPEFREHFKELDGRYVSLCTAEKRLGQKPPEAGGIRIDMRKAFPGPVDMPHWMSVMIRLNDKWTYTVPGLFFDANPEDPVHRFIELARLGMQRVSRTFGYTPPLRSPFGIQGEEDRSTIARNFAALETKAAHFRVVSGFAAAAAANDLGVGESVASLCQGRTSESFDMAQSLITGVNQQTWPTLREIILTTDLAGSTEEKRKQILENFEIELLEAVMVRAESKVYAETMRGPIFRGTKVDLVAGRDELSLGMQRAFLSLDGRRDQFHADELVAVASNDTTSPSLMIGDKRFQSLSLRGRALALFRSQLPISEIEVLREEMVRTTAEAKLRAAFFQRYLPHGSEMPPLDWQNVQTRAEERLKPESLRQNGTERNFAKPFHHLREIPWKWLSLKLPLIDGVKELTHRRYLRDITGAVDSRLAEVIQEVHKGLTQEVLAELCLLLPDDQYQAVEQRSAEIWKTNTAPLPISWISLDAPERQIRGLELADMLVEHRLPKVQTAKTLGIIEEPLAALGYVLAVHKIAPFDK